MIPTFTITTCAGCPFAHRNPVKITEVPLRYVCLASGQDPSDVSEMVHQRRRPESCPLRGKKLLIEG